MLGYSWYGCTNGDEAPIFAKEWSEDFGVPSASCYETERNSGIFERKWSKATVAWDCAKAEGTLVQNK